MDAAGAVEILMPALTPIGLFEQSGRIHAFGDVLIKLEVKRQNRRVHMALGPTHEETITDLVSHQISSYRQMPLTMYQIQTKFRNEERPRFGVLRTSEFLMKDAYSFDATLEGLNKSYDAMYAAYCKIFQRMRAGLPGGRGRERADRRRRQPRVHGPGRQRRRHRAALQGMRIRGQPGKGRDRRAGHRRPTDAPQEPVKKVPTPGRGDDRAGDEVLKCSPQQMIKTLIFAADGKPVAVLLRGDHEANEGKIRRAAGAAKVELAEPAVIEQVTGAPVGFAGPVGLKQPIPIFADREIERIVNGITGANEAETHLTGVNLGRDFQPTKFADLRNATDGDPCPRCSGKLAVRHAIEVGHVFKLGTKYSESLNARFLDQNEQLGPIIMGCYGIGVNRIIAALIETSPRRQRRHLADDTGALRSAALAGESDRPGHEGGDRQALRRIDRRRASTCCWTTATSAPA